MNKTKKYIIFFILISIFTVYSKTTTLKKNKKENEEVKIVNNDYNINVKKFDTAPKNPKAFTASVYILTSENPEKGTLIIDAGYFDNTIKEYLGKKDEERVLLLTHAHWDHLFGLDNFKNFIPNLKVYIHEKDRVGVYDDNLNFAKPSANYEMKLKTEVETLKEGMYEFAGYKVEVIHLPGHSDGLVVYYLPEESIMFAGDFLNKMKVQGKFGEKDHSNNILRRNSIEKFKKLKFPDYTKIYTGHDKEVFTYKELMEQSEDLK